jgi:hypothetical protein
MPQTDHPRCWMLTAGAVALAAAAGCGSQAYKPTAAPTVTITKSVPAKAAPTATPSATPKPAPTVTVTARPTAAAPAPAAGLTSAEAVVTQFYQDITDHNYAAAWALGGDNISNGVSYASWVAGYSTTASITLNTYSQWGFIDCLRQPDSDAI